MADLIFHGQFINATDLDGETGLTVTIDVYRTTISDGTTSTVVSDGSCTETGGGIYRYRYASADLSLYHYVGNMKTASADVAQKHVAALGMVVPDALVSAVPAAVAAEFASVGVVPINEDGATLDDLLDELADAHGDGSWEGSSAGSGTGSYTDTITDDDSNPLDGVRVQLSTDSAGTNVVYEDYTDALGVFAMRPDPGTYYRWLDLAGYTFTQGVEVEVS